MAEASNPEYNPLAQTQSYPQRTRSYQVPSMASSMTLAEMLEPLMTVNAEKDAQIEYLRKQLEQAIKNNRREIQSSHSTSESNSVEDESESNPFASSEEEGERRPRRPRRGKQLALDFKVEIP